MADPLPELPGPSLSSAQQALMTRRACGGLRGVALAVVPVLTVELTHGVPKELGWMGLPGLLLITSVLGLMFGMGS